MRNILYITGLLYIIASCSSGSEEKNTTATPQPAVSGTVELNRAQIKNARIQMKQPVLMGIGTTIRVTGSVEVPPQNKTAISFPFGGFVRGVEVLDGMQIKQGQTLVTLEDPAIIQLQQDYLEAMSQLEYLKLEYERQKTLGDQQVNSGKTVQQAKSAYLSTQARCKGMKLKLEMAGINPSRVENGQLQREVSVRAPFNGVVTKMNAAVGHYVTPQEVLLEIIDLRHSHIELFVFEKDIPQLKIAQKVHIRTSGTDDVRQATIYLIGREIGADRMVKVHCHLDKEDPSLIPGSFVNAEIDLTDTKQLTVPSEAIVNFKGRNVVFWKKSESDGAAIYELQEVEMLGEEEGRTAIRYKSGNATGKEEVAIKGAYAILSVIMIKMEPEE
jgi:cobalt-zinc-cadmium efflux system membrane fusion protein